MQNPASPSPPPPAPSTPGVLVPGTPGASEQILTPMTAADVATLQHRRSELSTQLNSANGRRDELAKDLLSSSGAAAEGITARIVQLDQRILQIESDIAVNGRLLAAAPASAVQGSSPFSDAGFFPGNGELAIVGGTLVLFPLALAVARLIWRRTTRMSSSAPVNSEVADRLAHIEQAVDAIAIEVERVSESQRFLTRSMVDAGSVAGPAALGAGAAPMQPIALREEERVPIPSRQR
ncbi:MAG TPA: hypothetical protein VFG84_12580 [Gemmatimonadaceae bacterium]|nr:hypothetical protein [Gemmatimonadaceae bacterium]